MWELLPLNGKILKQENMNLFDEEWIELIHEALSLGITAEEIKEFLNINNQRA